MDRRARRGQFLPRSDGSRLRYFTAGTGPPLVLLHTVRTQLDYFQRVVPGLWDEFSRGPPVSRGRPAPRGKVMRFV